MSGAKASLWEGDAGAKVNLMLVVGGKRTDDYHELVSLVAPIAWSDRLTVSVIEGGGCDLLEVTGDVAEGVPTDGANLVLQAAELLREHLGWKRFFEFKLEKKILPGSGLGAGSGDAAASLRGMVEASGESVPGEALSQVGAKLGADVPLFLGEGPVWMRGKGEQITPVGRPLREQLRGQRIWIFRPFIGIETPWAYRQLDLLGRTEDLGAAEQDVDSWEAGKGVCRNTFEGVVFEKYLYYKELGKLLEEKWGVTLHLSGSGSACFILPPEGLDAPAVRDFVEETLGPGGFFVETTLL